MKGSVVVDEMFPEGAGPYMDIDEVQCFFCWALENTYKRTLTPYTSTTGREGQGNDELAKKADPLYSLRCSNHLQNFIADVVFSWRGGLTLPDRS
jgi:Myeloma-overexpressed-like